jgi:hypothetical protein
MDWMGRGTDIMWHLDLDGHEGQGHTKGIDGIDVPTIGDQRRLQLVIIKKVNKINHSSETNPG